VADRAILLYDGDCGFCRWCVGVLLRWDRERRLYPVAIQGPRADRFLAGLGYEERIASWHLVSPDGRRYSAGAAFPPLLRLLPGGAPLAAVAARLPRTVSAAYFAVARSRSLLGRLVPARAKARADARIASARKGEGLADRGAPDGDGDSHG
jgi:predicted DCC family thiol-disulfide oxidoreductase YuxK